MSVSINQMIRAMHKARHEIEINQIGGLSAELAGIFDAAERKLYRERNRFFRGLSTNSRGEIIGSVKNIEAARKAVVYVKGRVDKLVKVPGMVWGDKMVKAMGEAGRELARVNLTTDFIPQAKIDAVFKHISSTERAILKVGRYDAYSIIGTIGDDINEFFRREMLDSVAAGIPIQGPGDSLANRLFASGRLKAIPVYTKDGRTIMRSARTRANAIARIESAKILNATHEDVTKEALGDEAVYRNSNPRDSRTTDICRQASRQEPMTLLEWSRTRFGRPPRLRPFHLCRSVLIGGMKEWFEDDGNPEPVQDAKKPPQPENPKIKGPQDFDDIEERLKYYNEGDNIALDLIATAARHKREVRRARKEIAVLEKERQAIWDVKDQKPRLKEVMERKKELSRLIRSEELRNREYAAKIIGNNDTILVDGLPIEYKKRTFWTGFDKESQTAVNNLLAKKSNLWSEIKERATRGRDYVNRLVHRGGSDLPEFIVESRTISTNYVRAKEVLRKNLDDGFISQSQFDVELKAINRAASEFNKWEIDHAYQTSFKDAGKLIEGHKKVGWEPLSPFDVEIRKYGPFKGVDYDLAIADQSKLKNKVARAFHQKYKVIDYTEKRGLVVLDKSTPSYTMVHELGHVIESNVSGVHEAAKKFLRYRTRGETASQLSKVFPGYGYGSSEVGKRDKFKEVWLRYIRRKDYFNASDRDLSFTELERLNRAADNKAFYTGKEYAHPSSEIISMGIELLYEDAVTFARYDREYFKFIVGILRGDLRYY
jgi:hypothetical protein